MSISECNTADKQPTETKLRTISRGREREREEEVQDKSKVQKMVSLGNTQQFG